MNKAQIESLKKNLMEISEELIISKPLEKYPK